MTDLVQNVLAVLKTKLSDLNFNNWIKPAEFSLVELGFIEIAVPNKFIRDWISENYVDLIRYEFFRVSGREYEVRFTLSQHLASKHEVSEPTLPLPASSEGRHTLEARAQSSNFFAAKYSFESFVVGAANQFAHAAAMAVAQNPAKTYNPLFLYGGVGLGKTHLLSAIGHSIFQKNPKARMIYISGENFTNELICAIRDQKMFEFRKKFRDSCDVLLVDDVQFIAGKERTQEEFFHTFNYLYESRKQVVLTSDRVPKDITQLEERLRSRFEWGLIADVQAPDYETRIAILNKKATADGFTLPGEVAEYLATHVRSNIRELEGSLIRIGAYGSLSGAPITLDLAKEVLKNLIPEASRYLTIEGIQKMVADHYRIKITELKSARRLKTLTNPRQVAMYLCRKHVKASFPELGMKFGGKDHSTVVHAVQKVERKIGEDEVFRRELESLEKFLSQTHR